MSLHVFGAIVTHHGTAANNRAETEGNITTLQKLLWFGRVHSTVSAEAIRFALRRRLAEHEETNRYWDESGSKPMNNWRDGAFQTWAKGGSYIDDDLLGFMSAEAAKQDGSETSPGEEAGNETPANGAKEAKGKAAKSEPRKPKAKGTATIRRSPLEITRAISLGHYGGDVTFNAASPGATPSAQKGEKGVKNPVPYGTEVHATRYQYGFALTPKALRKRARSATAIQALCALGEVAGNHGRFLYDFSPESVIFRITRDPAPRLLYIFHGDGPQVDAPALLDRVRHGDLPAEELILGGAICDTDTARGIAELSAILEPGVRNAARRVCDRIAARRTESMLALRVTVPVACFRKGFAREFWETEELPPPATCYGFLLSMVGERNRRRHVGARVCPALLSRPERSAVLRTLWRVKDRNEPLGSGTNARPDYQELLTQVHLAIWLDSAEEVGPSPTLEDRVNLSLDHPEKIDRFGGLSLGESTHLVDEVSRLPPEGSGPARAYLLVERGRLSLPVWVDHVGSAETRFVTGDLQDLGTSVPLLEQMPRIQPL